MSSQPVSRTVSDLAKQLKASGCTNAHHTTVVHAVEIASKVTKDRIARLLLAADLLEKRGYTVHRQPLIRLVQELQVKQQMKGGEAEQSRNPPMLERFQMPADYSATEAILSPHDSADQPFSLFHWWPSGRSLGVYGADLDRRGTFVSHLIRSMSQNGTRTVVPVRQTSQADPRLLAPAAEVADLTETPGGIGQLMAELEMRILEGEDDMIVLVDPRHGLEEADLDALAQRTLHPDSSIRVVYTESFALRGWTSFMDSMLDYAQSVLLGPAPAADLATFGLPADYEVPEEPGSGLYLQGDVMECFGAPESTSAYRDAHLANTTWGTCGHRPATSNGVPPTDVIPGDRLWFWGTLNGNGWKVEAVAPDHDVIVCSKEDGDHLSLSELSGPRQQIISFKHGLREEHSWSTEENIAPETGMGDVEEVSADGQQDLLRFSDGALRLDLRAVIRGGRMAWIDKG